jgi:hypothetical protein
VQIGDACLRPGGKRLRECFCGKAGVLAHRDATGASDEQQKRGASLEAVSDEPGLDTGVSWVLHVTAAPKLRAQ